MVSCTPSGRRTSVDCGTPSPKTQPAAVPVEAPENIRCTEWVLPVVAAASSFCALAAEILWVRMLGLLIGPLSTLFAVATAACIAGSAAGGYVFGRLADRSPRPVFLLTLMQMAAAAAVLGVCHALGNSQLFYATILFATRHAPRLRILLKCAVAFLFVVWPAAAYGATLPLAARAAGARPGTTTPIVGRMYACMNLGAAAGAAAAAYWMLPRLGQTPTARMLAGIGGGTGALLWYAVGRSRILSRREWSAPGVVPAVLLPAGCVIPRVDPALSALGRYCRFGLFSGVIANTDWWAALAHGPAILAARRPNSALLYYGEDVTGPVAVMRELDAAAQPEIVLLLSGKPDASSRGDLATEALLGRLPLLLHPRARDVLIIGLGSGITAAEAAGYPLRRLDVAEVSPCVVRAAEFFADWNRDVLRHPEVHILLQDACTHILLADRQYDVVVSEPSNPWMAGEAALFTLEFFQHVRRKLRPGGVFVQWMHSYQSDWTAFSMLGRTFTRVFPDALLFRSAPDSPDYLLVGFKPPAPDRLRTIQRTRRFSTPSPNMELTSPSVLLHLLVTDQPVALFGDGPLHTDDRPRLEWSAERAIYLTSRSVDRKIAAHARISPEVAAVRRKYESPDEWLEYVRYALSVARPFQGAFRRAAPPDERKRTTDLFIRYAERHVLPDPWIIPDDLTAAVLSPQLRLIAAALTVLEDPTPAYLHQGRVWHRLGEFSRASRFLTRAARMSPLDAAPNVALGALYFDQKQFDEAAREFRTALELNPDIPEVQEQLANALYLAGKHAAAKAAYRRALAASPDDPRLMRNFASLLAAANKPDEAEPPVPPRRRTCPRFPVRLEQPRQRVFREKAV